MSSRLATAAVLLALIMASLVGVSPRAAAETEAQAQARAGVAWKTKKWSYAALPGTAHETKVGFTLRGKVNVKKVRVQVQGKARKVVKVDRRTIQKLNKTNYSLPLTVVLPESSKGSFTGKIVLKVGKKTLGKALPVTVKVKKPSSTKVPAGTTDPTPARVGALAGGQTVTKDEIVVGVSLTATDPVGVARRVAKELGGVFMGSVGMLRLYQVRVPGAKPADLAGLAKRAESVDGVEFASFNYFDKKPQTVIPDDSQWDSWDVANPAGNNWGMEAIDAPAAWDRTTGSSSVKVAVIDFDNDDNHGDLDDNVTRADRGGAADGHGTHVGGAICAEGNNGKGVTGVMWDCDLRYYAGGDTAIGTAEQMIRATNHGARVVNLSLNYIENGNCEATPAQLRTIATDANDIFGRAVIRAQRDHKQVLWAIAAGNECGRDAELTAPGGLGTRFPETVMTVAAVGVDGNLAGFSNTGDSVSVAAPGVDIYSTVPRTGCVLGLFCNDAFATMSGTSMATPHVAGLAGLVIAADPSRPASEVKRCILSGAQSSGNLVPGTDYYTINAPAAVDCDGIVDLPSKVDVVLALDLTGSMGGVLSLAQEQTKRAISDIKGVAPGTDFQFSVVSYEDYEGDFDSTPCGSSYADTYGEAGDQPFRLVTPLTSDAMSVQDSIGGLSLGSGSDGPESYGRMLWELAQTDTGSSLGWRAGALRLVVNFGDNVPHDTDINEGVDGGVYDSDTGVDPGRNGVVDCGGDDIDFQDDALMDLKESGARLLHVDSSGGNDTEPYWRYWSSLTGGGYTQLESDHLLSEVIIELLGTI